VNTPHCLLVLPIYNEDLQLESSVRRLYAHATEHLSDGYDWEIVVADNASTDRSPEIYAKLAQELPKVRGVRLEQKGRGRMLKHLWMHQDFDVSLYMDLDLSTDLKHIRPSLDAITQKGFAISSGSRLLKESKVEKRTLKREVLSRGYIRLVRALAGSRISDFQCGFKAISKNAALQLVPLVEDTTWFFDSELLIIGEKAGFPIHQEPVHWIDDAGTTVHIWNTAVDDLVGLRRVMKNKPWHTLKP
jgi:glycosyltransferase involved in cell wall biosynthesis